MKNNLLKNNMWRTIDSMYEDQILYNKNFRNNQNYTIWNNKLYTTVYEIDDYEKKSKDRIIYGICFFINTYILCFILILLNETIVDQNVSFIDFLVCIWLLLSMALFIFFLFRYIFRWLFFIKRRKRLYTVVTYDCKREITKILKK